MSLENPGGATDCVSAPTVLTPRTVSSFEERWAAWQARGAAHDRAFRRNTTIALPIVLTVAALLYAVLAQ
jgi:hypothetical protein